MSAKFSNDNRTLQAQCDELTNKNQQLEKQFREAQQQLADANARVQHMEQERYRTHHIRSHSLFVIFMYGAFCVV